MSSPDESPASTSLTAVDSKSIRPHLFGRRKGKRLRPGLQALMETELPRLRIALEADETPCEPRSLFDPSIDGVWLEIGFGGGEHLAAQADAHPNIGFIGAEIFESGIASLLRHRETRSLTNIRLLDNDARAFLPRLADGSLDRVFLLYPDPWPKFKHRNRRFISPEALDQLARVIRKGAEFRVATDHPTYARWCLRHIPVHPAFQWTATGPECWRTRPADGVATRYEQKAIREGRTPMYLTFVRV